MFRGSERRKAFNLKEKLMEAFVEMAFCAGQTDGLNKVKQLLKEDEKNV